VVTAGWLASSPVALPSSSDSNVLPGDQRDAVQRLASAKTKAARHPHAFTAEDHMSAQEPPKQCSTCAHFAAEYTAPHPGDHGITYEPRQP
jgi:hypothetical protein